MEVLMEEASGGELEISGCSSNSTIEDDIACAFNGWSPVVDWGPFSGDDDFHGLIESMMFCDADKDPYDSYCGLVSDPMSSTTTSDGSPVEEAPAGGAGEEEEEEEEDGKGLRLVHLLMAAAEALTGAHKSRDLARVILVRLKELVSPAGGAGRSNMERLAAHFTDALQGLLDGSAAAGSKPNHHHHRGEEPLNHRQKPGDVLAAFQLLQDMSPYVKFGHFTANQAILEAVATDRRVHIIDYDIMEGVQWASLMQAMVSRTDGPPPPHLRITAVARGGGGSGGGGAGRKSPGGTVQETGRRLVAFAASIGQPFSFAQCRLDPDDKFRPAAVKLVKGEAVVANCVLHPPHLPHRPAASVSSFLAGAAALGARLVTVVEEEGEVKGKEEGFVGRFMDELYRYSAMWDSLEAGFPMQGRARGLVERAILGPRIAGAVGGAYRRREEDGEGEGGWGDWMAGKGFGRVGISFFNHCQARLLLGLFNDGYRVEEDGCNKLVLGWKSRRLVSASVWSAPPAAASGVANNQEDFE